MKKLARIKQPHIGLSPCTTVLVTSSDDIGRPNIIPISWIGVITCPTYRS